MAILRSSVAATSNGSVQTTVTSRQIANYKTLVGRYGLPFARSIPIMCEVTGMKPFTTLHGFIDGTSIDSTIYPCVQVTITNEKNAKFLGYSDVSPANTWTLLRDWDTADYQGNLQSLYPNGYWAHSNMFTKGEVIRYYTSPTTFYAGVVVARQVQLNPSTRVMETVLHIVLSRYYVTAGSYTDNFISSVGASIPVGATIRGDISGATATVSAVAAPGRGAINTNSLGNWFGIYMIPAGAVRSGVHDISFSDSPTNDSITSLTQASSQFTSHGELDVYTNTIINRIDTFVRTTIRRTIYTDPLAETFVIPTEKVDGCFVTSVDIYFAQKSPTETQPVECQICETLNGYPTNNIVFNAVAQLSPDNIVVSKNSTVASRFRFSGPVYLEPGKEYCIKLLSNSVAYRVWISQMGEASITDPTKFVTAQPYLGVLFKSQNNSTWTPDQLQDLKFKLYYAEFDISRTGAVRVHNQSNLTSLAQLPVNPFMVANGSATCKVNFPNHGLFVGAHVKISGAGASVFNNSFVVATVIDTDHFTITLSAAQTFNGLTGGALVKATKSIKYDALSVSLGDYSVRKGTGILATMQGSTERRRDAATTTIDMSTQIPVTAPHYIHSDLNEGLLLSGVKSLDLNLNLLSSKTDLSPVINRNTLSVITFSNKISVPSTATNTVVDNHTIASALAGFTFTAATGVIGVPTSQDINQYKIGAYITVSGTTSNNRTFKITNIDKTTNPYKVFVSGTLVNELPAATTIVQAEGYIEEIAPTGGTAESKYQSVPITLAQPATSLQIMFAANVPPTADIIVYYRTTMTSSNHRITDSKWVAVPMSYRKSQGTEFLDQTYTINALANFNTAQFKIVMVSKNTSQVPRIKDFRAICLA